MKNKLTLLFTTLVMAFVLFGSKAYASQPIDEIKNYTITVNVNKDATLDMYYHIEWLVLESDKEGPVSWIDVGIPNAHYVSYDAVSSNIENISYSGSNGAHLRIDFKDKYYAGDTILVDFHLVQDYMYQVDKFTEGETVYTFTPGWFDEIDVDELVVIWKGSEAISWTPDCYNYNGDLYFSSNMPMGTKYTITVTYPNDAYGFDLSKIDEPDKEIEGPLDVIMLIVGIILVLIIMLVAFGLPILIIVLVVYAAGQGLRGTAGTTKKITRTLVKYYPTCPGCGAVRAEGKEKCEYCGRSFIESEEIVEEKDIPNAKDYSKAGLYKYGGSNSYMRVHVVSVPIPRTSNSVFQGSHGSSHTHSSCAHSSCACACACACAGGGRAGCSTKDFYNTNLKLKQLELKKKHNKEK